MMEPSIEKATLLIVDDNPKNLQVLGSLLSQNGYNAIAAQNGKQALQFVRGKQPELILLDIMMPEMDGFEVCRQLKDDETTRQIPVLFITALTESEDKIKAFKAGGADFITKPFMAEEVLARIEVHLKNRRLLKQLTDTNEHLKELNNLKDSFLGIAAHDIRSPLSGVIGMVQLLLEGELGELNEEQEEFLSMIFNTGNQIMNLVGDLLDVSVIESGNLKISLESTFIKNIIEDRIRLHQMAVRKKNIKLLSDLIEVPPITIDPERIGQVLDNLLSNAAKFSPENSTISLDMKLTENRLKIGIKDNGPGISDEDRENLFGMYRKLTARPTSGEKSSGLGLAICKKIMDAHKGDIEVESTPGKGAKFSIVIPLEQAD